MRSSNLAVCILTLLASVEAAPQAYGSLPVFGGPRPVPGPGSTVPSRVKALPAPAAQGRACAADIDRLASGISQNIIIQAGELSTAQSLLLFLQAGPDAGPAASNATAAESPPNAASNPDRKVAQFTALKGQLLAFVNAGVALRVSNQAITPSGSLIINGLAQVANAQQGELAMASSLSGDPTTDIATVQSLQKAFTGGRRQNGQNLLDVTQNCMPSDPTAQRTVMGALGAGLRPAVPIAVIPVSTPASTP
ncbi:hypothetical protein BLS_008388 [Venturia inaequalis]|uniref:Cell wall protein n=1 Tax=Venturia inaequalis TaxID=5025 RepID=A0A8H3UDJ3_VENIN|nr:hypothetical protein BLS_008388 [Venturia inaequalis]KAE9968566.1 hypothetical protein EG328_007499 [Venturia inaequalis]